jgi:hypothetical protein
MRTFHTNDFLTMYLPQLTGVLMSTVVWDEVLQNVFTTTVSGVDCVLETENQVYTYHVTNGVANLK